MPSTPEVFKKLTPSEKMITHALSKATAERAANLNAQITLKTKLRQILKNLGSGNPEEFQYALAFIATQVPKAAVTLAEGAIFMSEDTAKNYGGVQKDHIVVKRWTFRPHEPQLSDKYIPRVTMEYKDTDSSPTPCYYLDGNPLPPIDNEPRPGQTETGASVFANLLSNAVRANDFQLVFELSHKVAAHRLGQIETQGIPNDVVD
jgi:hypothetical protein